MASKIGLEFKVGLIILVGIVIVAGSLYWLQGYRLASNSQTVRVRFQNVGSLAPGSKVTVHGVQKGKVDDFKLEDDSVVVELLISREVHLKDDATFTIRNMGVMGERFVAVNPGTDTIPFDSLKVAVGSSDEGIPEIMGLLGQTITELQGLITSFKESIGPGSTVDNINNALVNVSRVASSIADYLDTNQVKLDQTTENIYTASAELSRILTQNGPLIDSSLNRFDRTTQKIDALVNRLDSVAVVARKLADELESNEGTLQLLLKDPRLYDDLRRTADNIDDLVSDIKANPRKYINLKF
ncbi:MAG: MlaD family protein, partial [Anaerolineales bacterium]